MPFEIASLCCFWRLWARWSYEEEDLDMGDHDPALLGRAAAYGTIGALTRRNVVIILMSIERS